MIFWTAVSIMSILAIPFFAMGLLNTLIKIGEGWEWSDISFAWSYYYINDDLTLEELRRIKCKELNTTK